MEFAISSRSLSRRSVRLIGERYDDSDQRADIARPPGRQRRVASCSAMPVAARRRLKQLRRQRARPRCSRN